MATDTITTKTVRVADHREPAFQHVDDIAAADERIAAYRARHGGRKPNVLVVLMDDVGWGDFGCYGGGVAVGAPTPHIDRLATAGLRLTSCYSEPSCTPSRASLLTGRLPMRHGLQRPPMYGEKGGLQGEVTLAELLSTAGYVTQAVGKWHLGENVESQPQHVGFDDFYGFLSVSDMYTEWRDPYFFPEIVYSEEDREPTVQQVLRARHARRRAGERRGGDDPGPVAARRHVGHVLDRFPAPHGGGSAAVAPLPLHARRAFRQLPARALPRKIAGEASI